MQEFIPLTNDYKYREKLYSAIFWVVQSLMSNTNTLYSRLHPIAIRVVIVLQANAFFESNLKYFKTHSRSAKDVDAQWNFTGIHTQIVNVLLYFAVVFLFRRLLL